MIGLVALAQASALAEASAPRIFVFKESINGVSPSPTPASTPPWLKATITDINNGVEIRFDSGLQGNEFIDNVAFNLDDELFDSRTLNVECLAGACGNFAWQYTKNGFSVVNGGANSEGRVSGFDIGFLFGNHELQGGASTTITVTDTNHKPTAAEFDQFFNSPQNINWIADLKAAAKVKNIGSEGVSGEISGFDPPANGDPVPGPLPILGSAVAFQASRRLRRRLRSTQAPLPASQPI